MHLNIFVNNNLLSNVLLSLKNFGFFTLLQTLHGIEAGLYCFLNQRNKPSWKIEKFIAATYLNIFDSRWPLQSKMKANVSIIKLISSGTSDSTPSQRIKFLSNQFHPPDKSEIHTAVKIMHQLLRPNINYKYSHG